MKPESALHLSAPWTGASLSVDAALAKVFGRKWLVLLAGILGIAAAVTLSATSTRVYEATVVLAPTRRSGSAQQIESQFGDLAAMVGVSLPAGGDDNTPINLAYLKSRQFAAGFIKRHGMMSLLFPKRAAFGGPRRDAPTMEDAVLYFDKRLRTVRQERATGLITLSVRWHDRTLATQWANEMVADINDESRNRAIGEAQRSLEYLSVELQKTSIVGLREAIYRLMEENVKSIMLANVRHDFAFEVIDPATVPDPGRYVRPNWLLNIVGGFIFGMALGTVGALVMRPRKVDRPEVDSVTRRDRLAQTAAARSIDEESFR